MHVLALSNIKEGFRYLNETFDCKVESTLIEDEFTCELDIQDVDGGHVRVILVKSIAWPSLLPPNSQLVVAVDQVEKVVRRGVSAGGKVLEHSVIGGNALYVLQGPPLCDALRLVIAEVNSPPGESSQKTLVNTFTAWCSGAFSDAAGMSTQSANHNSAWVPPKGPAIPTIFPSVLHGGEFRPIQPNSSAPIPFKTEYFEGEVLLLVRTTPLAPQYKHIFQKVSEFTNKAGTTTFEVQCQGKFTKIPQGRLYIGAEITKRMNLGLFTRGICATVLQFVSSINPFIHSSFGDKDNAELPHITGPLWCLADKIVVTPPGSTPPPMGQLLPEDKEDRARRRSRTLHEESVDLNSTYSFSVNTDNIELCDWNMVNLPITNSMDLHTFWDDADIRLCCYCVPSADGEQASSVKELDRKSAKALAKSLPKHHYQATNQYLLCVQIEHLSNHPGRDPNSRSIVVDDNETSALMISPTADTYFNLDDDEGENDVDNDTSDDSDDDDDLFFDAVEGSISGEGGISRDLSRDFTRSMCRSKKLRTPSSGEAVFVPAVVVVSDVVRKRSLLGVGSSKRELYVFCVPVVAVKADKAVRQTSEYFVTIRSYKEFTTTFNVTIDSKPCAYSRMSRTERRRHDLCNMMSQVLSLASTDEVMRYRLITFFAVSMHMDYFLLAEQIRSKPGSKNGVGNPRLRADLEATVLKEGFVCTRQGQTHWSEEYLCITTEELIFVQRSARLSEKKRRRIPLEYIVSYRVIDSDQCSFPLEDCYCLLLSTFPKEFSVLVRGRSEADGWLEVLSGLLEDTGRRAINADLPLANSFKQLELLSYPMDWQMGSRVILNGRRSCGRGVFEAPTEAEELLFTNNIQLEKEVERQSVMVFNSTIAVEYPNEVKELQYCNESAFEIREGGNISKGGEEPTDVRHNSHLFPLLLVKKALRLISEISFYSSSMDSILSWENFLETHWVEFLDVVSLLTCIDLQQYDLSNEERICLFLNLYHTMLLHAVLIAGVPSTLLKWPSFFNSFSYEAFGDILSLSDLEHSIIKGAFKTNGLIPQVVIRQSKYDFALTVKDMRLLFAVNCGSLSMPSSVPIFQPEELEDQLDGCVRRCLRKQLHISRGSGKMFIVKLPLLCEWYEDDVLDLCNSMEFSSEYKKSTKLLRLFINYCGKEQKDILLELITIDKASCSFKFSKFDFRCRILKIMSESIYGNCNADQNHDLFIKRATL